MKNYYWYKEVKLMRGSEAYDLYEKAVEKGEFEKLDKHLKQLDLNEKELLRRYE